MVKVEGATAIGSIIIGPQSLEKICYITNILTLEWNLKTLQSLIFGMT